MDVLFFAAIAVFFAYRLWLVLGRRDGEAPRAQNPFTRRVTSAVMPRRQPQALPARDTFSAQAAWDDAISLDGAIARVKAADTGFDERQFLSGARGAFRMIVEAFGNGDRAALRTLVADDVYQAFDRAITACEQSGHSLRLAIHSVEAQIDAARLTGATARITVAFRSQQINTTHGADGTLISGDPRRPEEMLDSWIFARDTRSQDPNWMLVETHHQA